MKSLTQLYHSYQNDIPNRSKTLRTQIIKRRIEPVMSEELLQLEEKFRNQQNKSRIYDHSFLLFLLIAPLYILDMDEIHLLNC